MLDDDVRRASTVLLVRDAPSGTGLETMMLRRNLRSDFLGGAYVFPGGAVDPGDADPAVMERCASPAGAVTPAVLGADGRGIDFWVAAVRESFEEAGLLLARREGEGALLSFSDAEVAARFDRHRRGVDAGSRSLATVCVEERLELAVDELHPVAHWITPSGSSRRYDTWFLLGRTPVDQQPLHDDNEVIDHVWVRPGAALARHRRGDLEMMYPTVCLLEWLAGFGSATDALAGAADLTDVPCVRPRLVDDPHRGLELILPGEPGHADPGSGTTRRVSGAELLTLARARVLAHHPVGAELT